MERSGIGEIGVALTALALLAGGECAGQDAPGQPAREEKKAEEDLPAAEAAFSLFSVHSFSADFSDAPGSVSATRAGVSLDMAFPLTKRTRLGVAVTGEESWYNFDGATGFVAGTDEPWETIRSLAIETSFSNEVNDRWGYTVAGIVQTSGEQGAEFDDSISYGGFAVVRYSWGEDLTLGAGLGVTTRLEDDALVIPIPFVHWKISERWSLSTSREASLGGLALNYRASDAWTFGLIGGYEFREFRLDDDGGVTSGDVGVHWGIPLALHADWRPYEQLEASAYLGVMFAQSMELQDPSGTEIADLDVDAAPIVGATLRFKF